QKQFTKVFPIPSSANISAKDDHKYMIILQVARLIRNLFTKVIIQYNHFLVNAAFKMIALNATLTYRNSMLFRTDMSYALCMFRKRDYKCRTLISFTFNHDRALVQFNNFFRNG